MTEKQKLTADVLTNEITGTVVHPNTGEEYEAVFKDITDEERRHLNDLEERAKDGDAEAEAEFNRLVVEEYLLDPDFDLEDDNIGQTWKQSIFVGFLKALGGNNKAIEDAEEFFAEASEGNR